MAKEKIVQTLTYDSANEELLKIVNEIEKGVVSVDVLAEKVKRASELIRFCKEKLFKTEDDIQTILKELNDK
jgi:exodeoxyribonuclease VII small subunit